MTYFLKWSVVIGQIEFQSPELISKYFNYITQSKWRGLNSSFFIFILLQRCPKYYITLKA